MTSWSFGDWCLFLYNVLAGTVFLCQVAYFSALGLRVALKDRKMGTEMRGETEAYRELIRKQP